MKYMLDTTICIFLIKPSLKVSFTNSWNQEPGDKAISSITYAELAHGVEKIAAKERNWIALTMFLSEIPVVPFDDLAAQEYGIIKAELQKMGTPIGPMDIIVSRPCKITGFNIRLRD